MKCGCQYEMTVMNSQEVQDQKEEIEEKNSDKEGQYLRREDYVRYEDDCIEKLAIWIMCAQRTTGEKA